MSLAAELSRAQQRQVAGELVAEIGSASLCATMGIDTSDSLTNSAAYIKGWLKALKNDKKMIVFAAARAEKAVRMILNVEA